MKEQQRIFGLDVMRAIAILMVLCSHILWIYPKSDGFITQLFSFFGFWGVEIFFVLSGFLIGSILYRLYLQQEFTLQSVFYFLKRRWYRTLPNYFLVVTLNLILAILLGFYWKDIGYYFFFLQNFATTMKPFFPESWSLSIEEFAYLLVPFALLFGTLLIRAQNKSRRFIGIILVLMLVFFGHRVLYHYTTSNTTLDQWNSSLKAVVIYRIDAILMGIIGSWLSLNYSVFWKKQKANLAFLGCFLIVAILVGLRFFKMTIEHNPFFWNVLYLPITSFVFALFLPLLSQWQSAPVWFSKPVTFVSLTSYSVYLLHYSIILQTMKHFVDTSLFSVIQLHGFTFCYLAVTFFISFLLYTFFEKPIMNRREQQLLH